LKWTEEARKLIYSVPDGYQRRRSKAQIEKKARTHRIPTITLEMVQEVLGETVKDTQSLEERGMLNQTAVDSKGSLKDQPELTKDGDYWWTAEAVERIQRVPEGFMRNSTKKRVEKCAANRNADVIDLEITEEGIAEGRKAMEEMIRMQNEK